MTMYAGTEIHLWVVNDSTQAIGVNAAIMAENSGVENLDDVAVCSNALDDTFAGLLRASTTNESVFRVAAASGGNLQLNINEIITQCDKLLKGEEVPAFSPVNVDMVTPDNLADYGY